MVTWTSQDVHVGGSSLVIRKLWEICVCPILSLVNMTSVNFDRKCPIDGVMFDMI